MVVSAISFHQEITLTSNSFINGSERRGSNKATTLQWP